MQQQPASQLPVVFLNGKEAAALLRISVQTLYNHCRKGAIVPIRLGRRLLFRADVLLSFGKSATRNDKLAEKIEELESKHSNDMQKVYGLMQQLIIQETRPKRRIGFITDDNE